MPLSNLLNRLDKVKRVGEGRWVACCSAHDDKTPSLSIKQTDDLHILIHCYAGCQAIDVLAAVGLSFRDLIPTHLRKYADAFTMRPQPRNAVERANQIAAGLMEIELNRDWKPK